MFQTKSTDKAPKQNVIHMKLITVITVQIQACGPFKAETLKARSSIF